MDSMRFEAIGPTKMKENCFHMIIIDYFATRSTYLMQREMMHVLIVQPKQLDPILDSMSTEAEKELMAGPFRTRQNKRQKRTEE